MTTEYNNPTPVAVALIPIIVPGGQGLATESVHLLTGRRAIAPKIGGFAFPGGYINEGESAEEAASREVFEETGLKINPANLTPFMTRTTPTNNILIFCKFNWHMFRRHEVMAQFIPNSECDALSTAKADDTLCFPLHTEALKAWFNYQSRRTSY